MNCNNYFLRTAVATPKIKVADTEYNANEIIRIIKDADRNQVKILVLPELCLTGYTCQDLFLQKTLIRESYNAVNHIMKETSECDCLVIVGFPYEYNGKLYNVAGLFKTGTMLAVVPKVHLPNYEEFYEGRHFTKGKSNVEYVEWSSPYSSTYVIPFGTNILLRNKEMNVIIGTEICEDLWVPDPLSTRHALAGANVIVNPSASNETIGKGAYRKQLVENQSARLIVAYLYASAGEGESTQDLVFSGHDLIAENGTILGEQKYETGKLLIRDVDLEKLEAERRRMTTYDVDNQGYVTIDFNYFNSSKQGDGLKRFIAASPFVPSDETTRIEKCKEIMLLQALGLKKRMEHIGCKKTVIGVSGGLDSTLALLIINKTYEMMGIGKEGILAVTMPCFGTTNRTYENACNLAKQIGCTLLEIPIKESVTQHLKDISHDISNHDVTYENAQARERTQVLMDLANQHNALVIGTGDLSELVLGWCTYNGDHMSMYAVNADIPKTLVRYLVEYYESESNDDLRKILCDILETPVSPELLPPDESGKIIQKTEDKIGPYELHDFFLYYVLRFGYGPQKIFILAKEAFKEKYKDEIILKWMEVFYRRFFSQQFKRSCLPDGPKIGSVSISPRGDLRMPSDASATIWLKELNSITINR